MEPEQFNRELFALLTSGNNTPDNGFIHVCKDQFSLPDSITDMRAYIDSELQRRLMKRPYSFQYVICKSVPNELVFFDMTPEIIEYVNGVDVIYRYYDCDKDSVTEYTRQVSRI